MITSVSNQNVSFSGLIIRQTIGSRSKERKLIKQAYDEVFKDSIDLLGKKGFDLLVTRNKTSKKIGLVMTSKHTRPPIDPKFVGFFDIKNRETAINMLSKGIAKAIEFLKC